MGRGGSGLSRSRLTRASGHLLPDGVVETFVPLVGEAGKGAVLVHLADDGVDGFDERVVVLDLLVEPDGERLVEDRVPNQPNGVVTAVDGGLRRR